jgi:DNA-binding transcriptional ArsR family regulator
MSHDTYNPKQKRTHLAAVGVKGEELCPDCFRAVGVANRYKLVCLLGKAKNGMTVTEMTREMNLTQPTVTHHLNNLKSVGAVTVETRGREHVYTLIRDAHCFEECQIPY